MFFGLDERRGDIKWRWRIGGDVVGRPAFNDDMVFVITLSNEMRGFKLNDGGQKWRQPLDFRALGGPTRVGDVLVVPSFSPTLRGYSTKDGKRVGVYALPIGERSSPAAPPMVILREIVHRRHDRHGDGRRRTDRGPARHVAAAPADDRPPGHDRRADHVAWRRDHAHRRSRHASHGDAGHERPMPPPATASAKQPKPVS